MPENKDQIEAVEELETTEAVDEQTTEEHEDHEDDAEAVDASAATLEEEGDVAADYLEELLDIYDLDGDIDIDVRQGRAHLAITANQDSNLRLISKPETVEALQELTRLAVQVKTKSFSRLILDIGGSRQAKVEELTILANRIIAKVQDRGEAVAMRPMSSYERKIVHDIVAEAGLVSESEGEGRDRHIVVKPA
jgi:spoIIIJ-associated protein